MRIKILFVLFVILIKVFDGNKTEIRKYIKTSTEKNKNQFKVLKTERV